MLTTPLRILWLLSCCSLLLLAAGAGPTTAVTQGSLGEVSSGSFSLVVNRPAMVRISGLQDIRIDGWVGDQVSAATDFCIHSTQDLSYRLTASGSGGGGAFTLGHDGYTIAYTVGFAPQPNAGFTLLEPNLTRSFDLAEYVDPDCTAGDNSRLRITIAAVPPATYLPAGAYTGTLTLTVSAN